MFILHLYLCYFQVARKSSNTLQLKLYPVGSLVQGAAEPTVVTVDLQSLGLVDSKTEPLKVQADTQSQTVSAIKVDPQSQSVGAIKVDPQSQSVGAIKVDPQPQSVSAIKVDPQSQSVGAIKVDPQSQSVGAIKVDPQSQSVSAVKADPISVSAVKVDSKAEENKGKPETCTINMDTGETGGSDTEAKSERLETLCKFFF